MDGFLRIDVAPIERATRTPEGFLVAPATIARTGTQLYENPDGSTRIEYRPPEEVFHEDAIRSFNLKPITRLHSGGYITASNAKKHVIGMVTDPHPSADRMTLDATVVIYDREAIEAVERGERELSAGYLCKPEPVAGGKLKLENGTEIRTDMVQRRIRGNHVTTVPHGRAGAVAAIRLDAAGHQEITVEKEIEELRAQLKKAIDEKASVQLRLDALEKDLAGTPEITKLQTELAQTRGEAAGLKLRLDSIEKEAQLKERAGLISRVVEATGLKADDLAKLDLAGIMRATIQKLAPSMRLDDASEAYLKGVFETLLSVPRFDSAKEIDRVAMLHRGATVMSKATESGSREERMAAALKAAKERSENAWKPKN